MIPAEKKKNIILIVLALAFVLAVCGTSAAATEQNTTYNTNNNQVLPDPTVIRGGTEIANYTTIQSAINGAQSGDTIRLEYQATFNENINVNKALTFDVWNAARTGPGGNATINGRTTISVATGTVSFNNITFRGGTVTGNGGSISNNNAGTTLVLNNCKFISNTANGNGGAIYTTGTLSATNCTFTSNSVTGANHDGGAIYTTGTSTLTNCTFTSNSATRNGGAIWKGTTGTSTLTITGSNFGSSTAGTGNTAVNGGAIYNDAGNSNISGSNFISNSASNRGGAFFNNAGTATIQFNRIIGNTPNNNQIRRSGGTINAQYNWWGSNDSPSGKVSGLLGTVTYDPWLLLTVTPSQTPISTSGSSTVTADLTHDSAGTNHAPSSGHVPDGIPVTFGLSPSAIGSLSVLSGTTTDGSLATIFTAGSNPGTATVSATVDTVVQSTAITVMRTNVYVATNGSDTTGDGSQGKPYATILTAYNNVYPGGNIHIASGTYTGANNRNIAINKNVNIMSEGGTVTINAQSASRIFTINSGYNVSLYNLTLTNGQATGNGAAISNAGNLTINNCTFTNNAGSAYGGAIWTTSDLTVTNSTFTNNSASTDGGAISNGNGTTIPTGVVNVSNCIFTNNSATYGGALWSHSTLNVNNCTFTNNTATYGGAIRNWGNLTVTTSTFTGNTGTTNAGAISNYQGLAQIHFNRFIGNGNNDINAEYNGDISSVNAENNWWGTNFVGTNPVTAGRITAATGATVDADPWFVLKITASPNTIHTGETSTVTADLTWNSNNVQPTGGQLPNGMTVTFGGNLGTLNHTNSNIITTATSTFTAGSVPGIATVNATVDSQTVNTTITIGSKAALVINQTVNGQNTGTLNLNVGDKVTYLVTVTNNGPNTATGINISDIVPSGLTGVTVTGGTYDSGTGMWYIPSLANGSSITLNITGTIGSTLAGQTFNNTANQINQTEFTPQLASSTSIPVYTKKSDVSLTKTVNGATSAVVNVGDVVSFLITALNNGPDIAHNINISDIVPAGLTNVNITTSAGTSYSGGVWTITSLATGLINAVTLNITGIAGSSMAGTTVTNTATRTAQDEYNSLPAVSAADVYTKKANVTITNTANSNNLNVGQTGTFTITINNYGPDAATNININDIIPAGFTAGTPSIGTYDGNVWTIANLASGSNATLTFTGTITSAMAGTNITNHVTETQDEYPFTVSVPDATIHVNKADVTLSQNGSYSGNKVTFIVTATNNGPDAATGLVITDLITGLTGVTVTPSIGTYDPLTGIWTIGTLNNGTNATLTITGTSVPQSTSFNNVTRTAQNEYNSQPNNSLFSIYTPRVSIYVRSYTADGMFNYWDVNNCPVFVADVQNNGPDDATGVQTQFTFGNGLIFNALDTRGNGYATYNATTNTITWNIGFMPNGGRVYMDIFFKITKSGTIPTLLNLTNVNEYNSDTTHNQKARNLIVDLTPTSSDIQVTQTVNNTTPSKGDTITITITTKNNGPDNATGITVTDLLPAGLIFQTADTHGFGTYNETTGIWNISTLNNTDTATLTITALVNTTGTIINTATKTTPAMTTILDWNLNNNEQQVYLNVLTQQQI